MWHETDSLSLRLRPHVLVRVVVPSRDRSGRLLAASELVRLVEEGLSGITRGCMTFTGTGVYMDGRGREVREDVFIVESYFPEEVVPDDRKAFERLISELTERADQEALAVVVDGRLFFVPNPRLQSVGAGLEQGRSWTD